MSREMAHTPRHLSLQILQLQNPTKKHYTRFTGLPREVTGRILSWIEPKQVWKLRRLSKAFNVEMSSDSFARMRYVPQRIKCIKPSDWDLVYLKAPVTYQQAHVEHHWKHLTEFWWGKDEDDEYLEEDECILIHTGIPDDVAAPL
ncbi:hypothetical protein HDU98_012227 [Podochytrium sp. JEL0797]|nr:hypothetical protein HDU98_012227 [Podochytrium sp. JEL0797]